MSGTLENKFYQFCKSKKDGCENCPYRDSGDLVNCALNFGHQQGRADAIEEFCHWYFDMKNDAQINAVDELIKRFNSEQLKEKK